LGRGRRGLGPIPRPSRASSPGPDPRPGLLPASGQESLTLRLPAWRAKPPPLPFRPGRFFLRPRGPQRRRVRRSAKRARATAAARRAAEMALASGARQRFSDATSPPALGPTRRLWGRPPALRRGLPALGPGLQGLSPGLRPWGQAFRLWARPAGLGADHPFYYWAGFPGMGLGFSGHGPGFLGSGPGFPGYRAGLGGYLASFSGYRARFGALSQFFRLIGGRFRPQGPGAPRLLADPCPPRAAFGSPPGRPWALRAKNSWRSKIITPILFNFLNSIQKIERLFNFSVQNFVRRPNF
jgi:hypothetical protein